MRVPDRRRAADQRGGAGVTKRATFTQAELERAIRAAGKLGKVALMTPQGIAFVESAKVSLPSPEPARRNTCDEALGLEP